LRGKANASLDLARCEELLGSVVAGKTGEWTPLVALLAPALLSFATRSRSLGHRRSEDDCSDVMTAVLERLKKNDFRALQTFPSWREANPGKTLEDWLRIVTDRVACDYVTRKARATLLNTLGQALDSGIAPARTAMTDAQAVRELVEHADQELPKEQAHLLKRVLEGASADTVARETGESRDQVERRLRAAYARLRRWVDDDASAA